MRVGVVCEGPTDYVAIECFFGAAAARCGYDVEFLSLQPDMDSTQKQGGWTYVKSWLENCLPSDRVRRYFRGGLFANNLDGKQCDVFIIQIDSDILNDNVFTEQAFRDYGIDCCDCNTPNERREVLKSIIAAWSNLEECVMVDADRHILSPAVESTETWCVAAFSNMQIVETLQGEELAISFMRALLTYESRPIPHDLSVVDKSVRRRKMFCDHLCGNVERLIATAPSFSIPMNELLLHAENNTS